MVTHRWWGNKFCKRTCKDAYLRELALGRDKIRRWYGFFRGGWEAAPCSQTETRSRARRTASSQLCDEYKQSVMKNRTHFAHTASTCGPIAGADPGPVLPRSVHG
jgi:hypothetical protein